MKINVICTVQLFVTILRGSLICAWTCVINIELILSWPVLFLGFKELIICCISFGSVGDKNSDLGFRSVRRYVLYECFDLGILVANVSPTSEKYLQKPLAISDVFSVILVFMWNLLLMMLLSLQ